MPKAKVGSVVEVSRGRWRIRVQRGRKADGMPWVRQETIDGTRAMAEERARIIASEMETGRPRDMTLADWYARFREMPSPRGDVRAATTIRSLDAAMRHALPLVGHRMLSEVTHEELARVVRDSPSPVNVKRALRAVLRAAYDEGLMGWRAFERRVPTHRTFTRPKEPWTLAEAVDALSAPLSAVLRAFLALGLSGLRMEESLGLRGSDVSEVSIPVPGGEVRSVVAKVGWTYTDAGGHVPRAKNAQSVRTVPVIPQGRERVLELAREVGDGRIIPLRGDTLYRMWRRELAACGLRFIPPSHLRHTSDTLMLAAGVPADLNAKMHGRSDPATTYRHYLAPGLDAMEGASSMMGAELSKTGAISAEPVTPDDGEL